jgi:hypothetical protein
MAIMHASITGKANNEKEYGNPTFKRLKTKKEVDRGGFEPPTS